MENIRSLVRILFSNLKLSLNLTQIHKLSVIISCLAYTAKGKKRKSFIFFSFSFFLECLIYLENLIYPFCVLKNFCLHYKCFRKVRRVYWEMQSNESDDISMHFLTCPVNVNFRTERSSITLFSSFVSKNPSILTAH